MPPRKGQTTENEAKDEAITMPTTTETNEIAIIDATPELAMRRAPAVVLEEAQRAAAALQGVIAKKANPVIINNQQYLEFEDWQTIGRFYGVTAKTIETRWVDYGDGNKGFEAAAAALRSDGIELSRAESMCLTNEERWKDRELFQVRSMAQTRACAKALRNVLAWVVVLAGYASTPAEEMTGGEVGGRRATDAAPRPDGTAHVKSVQPGGDKKPTRVTFDDGRSATTFDKNVVKTAQEAQKSGALVLPKFDTVTKGDRTFTNLVDIEVVAPTATATEEPPHEEPVAETILTTRVIKGAAGGEDVFVLQGSEREYLTANVAVRDAAEQLRAAKKSVVVTYGWQRGRTSGRWTRIASEFTEAATGEVTR